MKSENTRQMVLTSLFAAIIVMLAFTPIGYIQLGVIKATIIHVPVIMGAILLGPKVGAGLGFLFGLTSVISNTYAPTLLSFAFSPLIPMPGTSGGSPLALIVAFIPRILVGIVPYYIYKLLSTLLKGKGKMVALGASGVVGSMTNTLLVMHLIYFLFKSAYAAARGIPADLVYKAVLAVIFGNGLWEAVAAGIITAAVCRPLLKYSAINKF